MTNDVNDNRRRHVRHAITGETAGRLLLGVDQTEIKCEAVDLSENGIGIVSDRAIDRGSALILAIKGVEVRMVVKWVRPKEDDGSKFRIGLEAQDTTLNLEDLFFNFRGNATRPGQTVSTSSAPLLNGTLVRAVRIDVSGRLQIHARTFGTMAGFDLTASNISRSGILLLSNTDETIPFRMNTLLEISIDPMHIWTKNKIDCLGKVVRVDQAFDAPKDLQSSFAVQLIEMSDRSLSFWDQCLEALQKKSSTQVK